MKHVLVKSAAKYAIALSLVWCQAAYSSSVDAPSEATRTSAGYAAPEDLMTAIEADYDANLKDLFEYFHANPELSFKETKTAKRLADELRALGYDVTENIGVTGVVALMENGPGKTILLRADMDGLPIKEDTDLPYASTKRQVDIDGVEKPVMHACGHDSHMAGLIGAARALAARKDQWSGTLVLIGQPAEERVSGAKAMVEDGLYDRFPKPDYALSFHAFEGAEAGKIFYKPGIMFSSNDSVDITVRGVGGHGASPQMTIDPVLVASHIVVGLQSIVSRNIAPLEAGVITVGSIHGGFKHNVIPEEVKLELTVRSDNNHVRDMLLKNIKRTAEGIAAGFGVPDDLLPIVEWGFESTPVTINDDDTTQIVVDAMLQTLPEDQFEVIVREDMGAEDFAYLVAPNADVKGFYFGVGGTPADEIDKATGHHTAGFKIAPRETITVGAAGLTIGALRLFQGD
ncbi:MAG: amidohydrolase [Pseudomonadota bacterium]